ncbi:MAG: N,N-dimethylformamidase beta subunit family domain-containing protein [Bacteroidia bacterium]
MSQFNRLITTLVIFFLLGIGIRAKAINHIGKGYMNKISYNPTDTASVYVCASASFTNATLYLKDADDVVVDSVIANLAPQSITNTAPYKNGFGYAVSFTYIIHPALKSGIYNWEGKIFFIVKSATKNADITLVYPSNTEAAYDSAGGKCFYNTASTGHIAANTLSFHRPLTPQELTYNRMYESPFMKWVNKLSGYSYQVICDQDLDDYTEIQNSRILCVVGHSEYWTRAARLNLDSFVNSGKDAIILSGNTMWWQVRYSADKTQIICYKSTADPITNPLLKTINWPNSSLHYPVLNSIGVDWLHGCYPPALSTTWPSWGGYKIRQPNSPLLAGTGLNLNDTLSCKTREYDGTLITGVNAQGYAILDTTTLGFCKIELIGYDEGKVDQSTAKGYGTFIAFKKTLASGNIINVASSNWCANTTGVYPGGFGGKDSVKIKAIILNMFNLLLAHATIYATPISNCLNNFTEVPYLTNNNEVSIYPNPTDGNLFIRLVNAENASVEVYNTLGQLVLSKPIHSTTESINLENLNQGVYTIRVIQNNIYLHHSTIILNK